jgi:hypothetical protein
MSNTTDVTGGKPIAVGSQSISGVNAINPLVAFYDIHGRKRDVLFFYFVPDTTRFAISIYQSALGPCGGLWPALLVLCPAEGSLKADDDGKVLKMNNTNISC